MANKNEWTAWRIITLPFRVVIGVSTFILAACVLAVFVAVMSAGQDGPSDVHLADDSILVLNPAGQLTETTPPPSPLSFLRRGAGDDAFGQKVSVRNLIKAIKAASTDDRIRAILIRPENLSGISNILAADIGAALKGFSATGKKVIAYGYGYQQAQYLLASYADEVLMHPMGGVLITGYSNIRSYIARMLDKLGIKVHLFRTGDFKSAAEPFIRDSMSDEAKGESRTILNTLWDSYSQQVADNRQLNIADLGSFIENPAAALADGGGDIASVAVNLGWVDKLMTGHEMREHLKQIVGTEDEAQFVNFYEYFAVLQGEGMDQPFFGGADAEIGLIVAEGQIVDQQSGDADSVIDADTMVSQINDAREDDDIKALVVRISSPGGSAFASERIRLALELFQASGRPVVISMGTVAASGGYWIASTADEIWASATTVTGSIGVFALLPTFEGAADEIGLSADGVQKGALSALALTKPLPDAYSRVIDLSVRNIYSQFLQRVVKGRGLPLATVEGLAQGKIWMGGAAKQKGLVDNIGDLGAALEAAAGLAKLEKWKLRELKIELPWWQGLTGFAIKALAQDSSTNLLRSIASQLEQVPLSLLLSDPSKPYALCLGCVDYTAD